MCHKKSHTWAVFGDNAVLTQFFCFMLRHFSFRKAQALQRFPLFFAYFALVYNVRHSHGRFGLPCFFMRFTEQAELILQVLYLTIQVPLKLF